MVVVFSNDVEVSFQSVAESEIRRSAIVNPMQKHSENILDHTPHISSLLFFSQLTNCCFLLH